MGAGCLSLSQLSGIQLPFMTATEMDIAITATLMELLRVLNFSPFVRPEGVE